jgi:two-component sensor histidine kinase
MQDVLRWPQRSGFTAAELQRGTTGEPAQLFERDRALADAEAKIAQRDRQLVELNHRFANSLQILVSSLRSDSRRLVDKDTKTILDVAVTRALSFGKLHRHLAEHEADERLDLYAFLNDIASDLQMSTGLRCDIDGEPVIVSGDTGFKLATAVTELVLNARKHAYNGRDGGVVCITCHKMGANQLRLSVSDRGKGLPRNFRPESAHGIGMSLVVAAAKDLNGELNIRDAGGASFTLIVPIERIP